MLKDVAMSYENNRSLVVKYQIYNINDDDSHAIAGDDIGNHDLIWHSDNIIVWWYCCWW